MGLGKTKKLYLRVESIRAFSLIEVVVAMAIFLVIASGVAGSLTLGLRSSIHARLNIIGKNAARELIEEVKARPYFVSYSQDPGTGSTGDIDLLDIYYPGLTDTSYTDPKGNVWSGFYTPGNDAHYTLHLSRDARGIEYTVETRFVNDSLGVVVPPPTYDSGHEGSDTPPSYLASISVITGWSSQDGYQTYSLDTLSSATNQFGTGHSGPSPGTSHWSNSHESITGGLLVTETGAPGALAPFVNGTLAVAESRTNYNNGPYSTATAIGGQQWIVNGSVYTGAAVSTSGPPDNTQTAGPFTVGPTDIWPITTISNTVAEAHNGGTSPPPEVEAESRAASEVQSLQLQQFGSAPGQLLTGYRQWYFTNPAIFVTGVVPQQAGAEIKQESGTSLATSSVSYQQINILPMQAFSQNTPSAMQGIVFIRNLSAAGSASANGQSGGASSSLTYSATIGMFNPNKSPGCTGDSCYDLYVIDPQNALSSRIDLAINPDYMLQRAIITEWQSYTFLDIIRALTRTADGTKAGINAGGFIDPSTNNLSGESLIKISALYGGELRLEDLSRQVTLVNPQGRQRLWLGSFDVSVNQNR